MVKKWAKLPIGMEEMTKFKKNGRKCSFLHVFWRFHHWKMQINHFWDTNTQIPPNTTLIASLLCSKLFGRSKLRDMKNETLWLRHFTENEFFFHPDTPPLEGHPSPGRMKEISIEVGGRNWEAESGETAPGTHILGKFPRSGPGGRQGVASHQRPLTIKSVSPSIWGSGTKFRTRNS